MHNTDTQKMGIGHILPGGSVARPLYTNTKDGLVLLHDIRAITNQHIIFEAKLPRIVSQLITSIEFTSKIM